ncbi:glycosyltransferase family 39 protein [Streptomyces sp. HNM0574]|uniref:glycosyltransferase family 39 protein n=1 Tax=Streptomyces sp. HNM0574 TaxID=2714954 RepID=UPI00146C6685|nr:glycosyltransferase family 39 protein [Streptomyces sp. HNM0574]NLU65818.1 glycosyltransferase [Streptomyces sp. HNM0574]
MPQPRPSSESLRPRAGAGLPAQRARTGTRNRDERWPGGDGPFWPRLLPLLALLTVLTRLPSLARPVWNPDEGFLATQARRLAHGGSLYDTVVDRKPPLLPLLYELAFALFGDGSLWPLKALAAGAVLAGAVLAASLARRRWGERAGRIAGVLYVTASVGLNPEDTQAATFEVFMLPWTVAAVWCADRGRWTRAGLCVAAAALSKQTGGAALVPVLALLWQHRALPRAWARTLAGAALPVLAAALAYGVGDFLYWTATGSGDYLSAEGSGLRALGRALASAGVLTLACAPALYALVHAVLVRRERLPGTADVWLWLASSAGAATVGFQFYGHYFLQLVPPLALLGAAALDTLRPRAVTTALALTGALATAFTAWGLAAPRDELDHQQRLAAVVRARTAPDDTVLLWGMHPEGYWFSGRTPASRYLTAGFLTNFSGGRGGSRVGEEHAMPGAWQHLRGELRRNPPTLIVDDSRGAPYGPAHLPTLRTHLKHHYAPETTVDGAVLYRYTGSATGR